MNEQCRLGEPKYKMDNPCLEPLTEGQSGPLKHFQHRSVFR